MTKLYFSELYQLYHAITNHIQIHQSCSNINHIVIKQNILHANHHNNSRHVTFPVNQYQSPSTQIFFSPTRFLANCFCIFEGGWLGNQTILKGDYLRRKIVDKPVFIHLWLQGSFSRVCAGTSLISVVLYCYSMSVTDNKHDANVMPVPESRYVSSRPLSKSTLNLSRWL